MNPEQETRCRLCGISFSPDRMREPCPESSTPFHEFFPDESAPPDTPQTRCELAEDAAFAEQDALREAADEHGKHDLDTRDVAEILLILESNGWRLCPTPPDTREAPIILSCRLDRFLKAIHRLDYVHRDRILDAALIHPASLTRKIEALSERQRLALARELAR